MNISFFILLGYLLLALYIHHYSDVQWFLKKRSRKNKLKLRKLAEYEKIDIYCEQLKNAMYSLGYKENIYLREHDTSIYESEFVNGHYFRAGDDGSISSKTLPLDELEKVRKAADTVMETVSAWQNGYKIRSGTLFNCRIIAQFDKSVLVAQSCYMSRFAFSIWSFNGESFTDGKKIGSDYAAAKEVFAAVLTTPSLTWDRYVFEPIPKNHMITGIFPANVGSAFLFNRFL